MKTTTRNCLMILTLAGSLIFTGCGGGGGSSSGNQPATPSASTLQIDPAAPSVPLGLNQKLVATAVYGDGSKKDVSASATWTSSVAKIATVSPSGVVTGVAMGAASITARLGSLTASSTVTVTAPALVAITLDAATLSIPPNTRQQLTALGTYSDDSVRDVTEEVVWSTSAPVIASVNQQGVTSCMTPGTVTIQATSGKVSGSANLTVTGAKLMSIAVAPYQPALGIGIAEQFTALGSFDDNSVGELASVAWSSSNPGVGSIDTGGMATAKAPGSTHITATAGAVNASTDLTVLPAALASIRIAPEAPFLAAGTSLRLTATGVLSDGSTRQLRVLNWSASKPQIATVNGGGVVQGVAAGSVQVTAQSGTITGSAMLQVTNAGLRSLSVGPANPAIPIWASKQVHATGIFSDGSSQDLTPFVSWTSHTPSVAKVTRLGLAHATSVGSTLIVAQLGAVSGSTTMTVNQLHVNTATVVPMDPNLSPTNPVIPRGVKEQLQLVGNLSDGSTQVIEGASWVSKKIEVATVDSSGWATGRISGGAWIYGEGCCEIASIPLKVVLTTQQSLRLVRSTSTAIPIGATEGFRALLTFTYLDPLTNVPTTVVDLDVTSSVHWGSSVPAYALIDERGQAMGLGAGATTITATFGPVSGSSAIVSASASLPVNSATLSAITVAPGAVTLNLGATQQFTALGSFSDGSMFPVANLTWVSSDARVAIAHESGLISTTGRGSMVVTASSGAIQGSASLNVN